MVFAKYCSMLETRCAICRLLPAIRWLDMTSRFSAGMPGTSTRVRPTGTSRLMMHAR